MDGAIAQNFRDLAQIAQTTVGAAADEHHVHRLSGERLTAGKLHVVQRAPGVGVVRDRQSGVDGGDLARMRAPSDGRRDRAGVECHHAVEACAVVAAQCTPVGDRFFESLSLRRARRLREVFERGVVRRDQSGARTGFDRHVAHGHALFHRQRADRAAAIFDDVPGAAVDADRADHVQDQILRGDADAERAFDFDRQGVRFALQQTLRRQHVADFAGADAERQRAERAVRRGVAVAADDGHARLGQPELGADHMHDAAVRAAEIEQLHAEARAVFAQRAHLLFAVGSEVIELSFGIRRRGRRGVIERAFGAFGATHRQAARIQFGERLR